MSCEFFRTNFPMSSLPIDQHLFGHIGRRYLVLIPCYDYISPSRLQWQVSSRKALLFDLFGGQQPSQHHCKIDKIQDGGKVEEATDLHQFKEIMLVHSSSSSVM